MAKYKTCGIYRIYHIESGKSYIGQSIRIEYRLRQHLRGLKEGKHTNEHLQRSYALYGSEAFATEILEVCSQDILTEREQYWMDFYRLAGLYNLAPVSGSIAGYKFSEEQCKKVSEANIKRFSSKEMRQKQSESLKGNKNGKHNKGSKRSKETCQKIRDALKGKVRSEAHCKALSDSQKGKKRTPHSEEHKAKLSEAIKLHWVEKRRNKQ